MSLDQRVQSWSMPQVRGKWGVTWQPSRDTAVVFTSYVLVVAGLFTAFQVFTTDRVAANFITFGPLTLAALGVALPVLYTVLVRHRSLADLGLTTHQLLPSIALGLLLGWDTYRNTIGTLDLAWTRSLVPLATMALAVGLFEAVFFRGWLQLRFEDAFGPVPGLVLAAMCYSLYHIGYGMALDEMLFLFGLGLVFGSVFRVTRNVFVLWPFYTPIGGLYTNVKEGLTMPFEATYGFASTSLDGGGYRRCGSVAWQRACEMNQQKSMSRRRFLIVAGSALSASVLGCGGLVTVGLQQPAIVFNTMSCGENKMNKILVAYASKCGSTGEVAEAIGQILCREGAAVDVRRVQEVKDLTGYSAVILGSAIRMGKPLSDAVKFAEKHQASLGTMPTACFITCATMKEDTLENRSEALAYLDPLRELVAPVGEGLFGGKVDHSTLSPLLRFAVSRDPSGQMAEGDWRDWQAIGDWAAGLRPALLTA